MEISWYGQGCFLIKTKAGIILCDPTPDLPKIKADIVTFTDPELKKNAKLDMIEGNLTDKAHVFDLPGEYEVNSIAVLGVEVEDKTVFTYKTEEIKLAHFGSLNTSLSDDQLETVNGIDVLFIPIGGQKTLDAKKAIEVVGQVDPRVVIPMGFPKNIDDQANPIIAFAKEEGLDLANQKDLLKISAKDLPSEEQDVYILKNLSKE